MHVRRPDAGQSDARARDVAVVELDLHGRREYKRNIVRVFVERGLRAATASARAA
jgi:CO/xanthine dehydrogenase FAD-binding subunit